jgi:hypothetical protein
MDDLSVAESRGLSKLLSLKLKRALVLVGASLKLKRALVLVGAGLTNAGDMVLRKSR